MAILDTDVSIASNGDIRWTGGATTNYTVLELHRFLGALADDASAINDDFVDITSDTPSERSTDNIITLLGTYNIDATMGEHLYDGSISQAAGAELYSGLRVLGSVNNINTQIQIVQNNTLYDGAIPFWGDQSTGGFNGDAVTGILFRCLVLSRTGGTDVDGKRIRVQARHWGDTYDFFNVTLGQGESVAALGTTPDAQNTTELSAVTGYTHVTNINEGYILIDLNNGNGAQPYYSEWTYGANTSSDGLKGVWEYIKYASGNGTAESLYGLSGELFLGVTHEISVSAATGTLVEPETLTWAGGGSGLLLATDSTTSATKVWIQLLTGEIPSAGLTLTGGGGGTVDTDAVISRTVPKTFLGSYTGSLIGAYGVGVLPANLVATDTIQDLNVATQTPPNNVTFTVSGLVAVEDRILVGPRLAGVLEIDQMSSTIATAGATQIVMQAAIPIDTPAAGTIRVSGDTGVYDRILYSGYTSATFDLSGSTLVNNVVAGANSYVSYIDKDVVNTGGTESFTTIFNTTRDLFVRVRDGKATPIKTFESAGTLGAAGGSTVASRITDE